MIDGRTVVGRSAARNTDVEAVDAIAPDLMQVSSYNTSTSNLPYVLRVRQVDPPNTPTCAAYARTGGVIGTMPDLTTLPADLATIILVNQQRLGDTFGAHRGRRDDQARRTLAARPDVNGVVIPVDGDAARRVPPTRAWNANPCATDKANKVVNEITRLVVGIRNGALPGVAAHPSLANVVIVGGDDIVPMARLDDTTRVGNETGYADEFDVNGPYFGALEHQPLPQRRSVRRPRPDRLGHPPALRPRTRARSTRRVTRRRSSPRSMRSALRRVASTPAAPTPPATTS